MLTPEEIEACNEQSVTWPQDVLAQAIDLMRSNAQKFATFIRSQLKN